MSIESTNEPHPALETASIKIAKALIDRDNLEDIKNDNRVAVTSETAVAMSFARPSTQDADATERSTIFDDPAMAIGLALAFGKVCRGRKTMIPQPVVELLLSHVEEYNAACALVLATLQMWGVVDMPPLAAEAFGSRPFGTDRSSLTIEPDMSDLAMNVGGAPDA